MVYVTVQCLSICLSFHHSAATRCCGPGRQDTSINSDGRQVPQQHSAQQYDIQQQMRAVSRQLMNADLLCIVFAIA